MQIGFGKILVYELNIDGSKVALSSRQHIFYSTCITYSVVGGYAYSL